MNVIINSIVTAFPPSKSGKFTQKLPGFDKYSELIRTLTNACPNTLPIS